MKFSARFPRRKCQVFLFTWLVLLTLTCAGQPPKQEQHVGFKTSFGVNTFKLLSDVEEINDIHAQFNGGSIGFFKGNEVLRGAINLAGFYYSADNVARTIDLIYSDATLSFFPLALSRSRSRIQPYVSSGISLSRLKFFGHYLHHDPSQPVNYSAPEPYLGKHKNWSALASVGIEYRSPAHDFLTFFVEASVAKAFLSDADQPFQNTSISTPAAIHIGVAFGTNK
jgi:hypothetical protein